MHRINEGKILACLTTVHIQGSRLSPDFYYIIIVTKNIHNDDFITILIKEEINLKKCIDIRLIYIILGIGNYTQKRK